MGKLLSTELVDELKKLTQDLEDICVRTKGISKKVSEFSEKNGIEDESDLCNNHRELIEKLNYLISDGFYDL